MTATGQHHLDPAGGPAPRRRARTGTRSFGAGTRYGHDSSMFYRRFDEPEARDPGIEEIRPATRRDVIATGDARMLLTGDRLVADDSVALVVTSPPYFVGKDYETGPDRIGDWDGYLAMLDQVLGRCAAKLEPGGRIAVNVANLGRRPYRPLAHHVAAMLAGHGLLLRGEIVWRKAAGAGGSAAWGTFRDPRNPVLRDVSERIVVASKTGFSRAGSAGERAAAGLAHQSSISSEDFLAATLDIWEIPAESATRVGHPAPYPVALAQALIELYSFQGDLILDPFIGSGTSAVAAARTGRHYIGIDLDPGYAAAARTRARNEPRAERFDLRAVAIDALTAAGPHGPAADRGTLRWEDRHGTRWRIHLACAGGLFDGYRRREQLERAIAAAVLEPGCRHGLIVGPGGRDLLRQARQAAAAGVLGLAAGVDPVPGAVAALAAEITDAAGTPRQ